jgi:hypothetical protein
MRLTRQTFAKGRTGRKVGMNKTEEAYALDLEIRKRAGLVEWYMFEGIKLRLADNTFLTPDFFVMLPDGTLEAHEVKGFMQEDANVKLKVAAALYPLVFRLVRRIKTQWVITVIGNVENAA